MTFLDAPYKLIATASLIMNCIFELIDSECDSSLTFYSS